MNRLASVMGVLALVAMSPMARADFEISVNGTQCAFVASALPTGGAICSNVTPATGVSISTLALSGEQTAGFSQEFGTTLLIANNSNTTQTITIDLGDTNFTTPTTPPGIMDASGLTVNPTQGIGSVALVSCVDQSNSLSPASCSPAPGEAGPNPALNFSGPGTLSNTTFGAITSLSADFSLTQMITLTLNAGANLNVTSSQVLTPAPEPAAIMLLGSAVMGLGLALRRKQSKRG